MRVRYHIALSVPLAGVLFAVFKSWELAAASLVSGILIDVDHFLDYFVEYGMNTDLHNFFSSFPEGRYRKIFILLHGWELLLLGAFAAWATHWNPVAVGLCLGYGHHMIADQLTNNVAVFGYSLLWRCARRFDPIDAFPAARRYAWNLRKGQEAGDKR